VNNISNLKVQILFYLFASETGKVTVRSSQNVTHTLTSHGSEKRYELSRYFIFHCDCLQESHKM